MYPALYHNEIIIQATSDTLLTPIMLQAILTELAKLTTWPTDGVILSVNCNSTQIEVLH